jgi:hypothetical protein
MWNSGWAAREQNTRVCSLDQLYLGQRWLIYVNRAIRRLNSFAHQISRRQLLDSDEPSFNNLMI